jgi:hypothetical protein
VDWYVVTVSDTGYMSKLTNLLVIILIAAEILVAAINIVVDLYIGD